jgi:hypothetical protein
MPQITDGQKLVALETFLQWIMEQIEEGAEDEPFIQILAVYHKTLQARLAKTLPTVEWIEVMKWAVVEANDLLDQIYSEQHKAVIDWNPVTKPQNMVQSIAAVLMAMQHELLGDVAAAEVYLAAEKDRIGLRDFLVGLLGAPEAATEVFEAVKTLEAPDEQTIKNA